MNQAEAPTTTNRLGPVVLGLLACGGAAWFVAGRTWASATLETDGVAPDTITVTGSDASPLVASLAVVLATAALAVLASRGWFRRVIGGLVVVLGVAGAVLCLTASGVVRDAVDEALRQSPAFTGSVDAATETTPWRWAGAVPFVLAAALGLLVAVHGHRWPGMSGRYDAPSAPARDDSDPWKALDEGRDPTL